MYLQDIHLPSRNLEAQKHFYDTVLGVPLLQASSTSLTYQIGASHLHLHRSASEGVGSYHFAMNIPPQAYDEALQWIGGRTTLRLDAEGSPVVHFENWDAHALYFDDPEGNSLEFIARHTLKTPQKGFRGAQDILSISEISHTTRDIAAEVKTLMLQTGEKVYKNSLSEEFAAIGTDEGLLIVVKEGREWFMTSGRVAKECPTRIQFKSRGETRILAWSGGMFMGMG